jgi:hypothetical protein
LTSHRSARRRCDEDRADHERDRDPCHRREKIDDEIYSDRSCRHFTPATGDPRLKLARRLETSNYSSYPLDDCGPPGRARLFTVSLTLRRSGGTQSARCRSWSPPRGAIFAVSKPQPPTVRRAIPTAARMGRSRQRGTFAAEMAAVAIALANTRPPHRIHSIVKDSCFLRRAAGYA